MSVLGGRRLGLSAIFCTVVATVAVTATPPASAITTTCSSTAAISYGAPALTGKITNVSEAACFTFAVVNGDTVRFNVRASSFSPFTDVFDSAGTSKCATPGDIECTADSTGTWTVQITASVTGTFHIFAQRLDGPAGCHSIAFGNAPLTGRVAGAADAVCYTFSGTAGDVILGHDQNLTSSGAAFMALDAPDGSQVCFVETGFFTCTLTQTGTQAVLAYYQGTETGKFSMYVQRMTKPVKCTGLTFGAAPLTEKIASVGAVGCFTYSGPTGALATVDPVVVSGTLSPETDLFSPAGVSTCATSGELHDCAISSTGTWTALIWDNVGTGTGTYTISAVDLDLSPLSGAAGTAVSVSSGGFKSGENVKVTYKTGLASSADVLICQGTASSTGTVSCAGKVPAGSKAGAAGRHVIQAAGGTSGHKTKGTFTLT